MEKVSQHLQGKKFMFKSTPEIATRDARLVLRTLSACRLRLPNLRKPPDTSPNVDK